MSRSTASLSIRPGRPGSQAFLPSAPRRIGGYLAAGVAVLAWGVSILGCGGDTEARMAEVRALQDVGQFTASIDELREILAVQPDNPEASYRLGVALVQTGESSRAVWPLEKAAESPDYTVQASLLLASAHFANQNFEAVVKAADRVLPALPPRLSKATLELLGKLGVAVHTSAKVAEVLPDGVRRVRPDADPGAIC